MKIISFSLYGESPRYHIGAIRNAELAEKWFPDWKCRFYVSSTGGSYQKGRINAHLSKFKNVELIHKRWDGKGSKPMFNRFLAASDREADHICFRDCDSRLSRVEAEAVNQWVESGANFHLIKGHPNHMPVPIMGGLWGIKGWTILDMDLLIESWGKWSNPRGDDQQFLAEVIWEVVKPSTKLTSLIFNNPYNDGIDFAGQPFDEHERKLC